MTARDPGAAPRTSPWLIVLEVGSLAVAVGYLVVVLYPDETARALRVWSWASSGCYGAAALLGRAGMACERHYSALSGGI